MAKHYLYRDSINGQLVTREYAINHPDTTTKEEVNEDTFKLRKHLEALKDAEQIVFEARTEMLSAKSLFEEKLKLYDDKRNKLSNLIYKKV